MTGRRVDGWGRIDRDRPLRASFDGLPLPAFAGDTLASAILAAGISVTGTSVLLDRPRGIGAAGAADPTGVVQLDLPFPEPMGVAATIEIIDGIAASAQHGRGRLSGVPDPAAYDTMHHHCDLLVVGAGPAGLTAAQTAARGGGRVLLVDEHPGAGGSLLTNPEVAWARGVADELAHLPNVVHLQRTTVTGYYDENYLIAVQRRTAHDSHGLPDTAARERVWRIRAGRVILATGGHERGIVFAGNDVPGVMLAESARAFLHRYGVLAGSEVVCFTAHDDAYRVAADLAAAGARVTVIDPRLVPATGFDGPVLTSSVVASTAVDPNGALRGVLVRRDGRIDELPADLLAVSGGWNPAIHLYSQAGGRLAFDGGVGAFVAAGCRQRVQVAGAARGRRTTAQAIDDGALAGLGTACSVGYTGRDDDLPDRVADPARLYLVTPPGADPRSLDRHFVDLQRDVTVADIARATGAGLAGVEHVKRYTTAGTAHDQGKTSGVVTTAIVAHLLGVEPGELGTTTYRPPYTPIAFAALAGRERGQLYDPVRTTSVQPWHVAHGAVFENVGQWKRPWFYPRPAETMEQAVARECAAARTGVAFMDGSTLGKIDVQGPDAPEFLDRLYTNMMSTVKVGSIRYGVMCSLDGMMLDDGTVMRIADDHFVTTTTTGNAAKILDWMEEWLQTEWPGLRVACTSVTEQWATLVLVGPRSRALMQLLAPDLALSAAEFGFMTWRATTVAGLAARVARISFSGELAYEVHLPWSDAPALWDAVWRAGAEFGLTPYGTEAMHVLRAEKGFPIIGQDTDGTVTPTDLGMDWVVSKKKADYLGKRSHARPGNRRADRKHLVGLLPVDPELLLPEGSQLVSDAELPPPPVPMLGHVTSSYSSGALRSTFALALVAGGRGRIGSRLYAVVDGVPQPVLVTGPVLYDPDNLRRDGDPDAGASAAHSPLAVPAPNEPDPNTSGPSQPGPTQPGPTQPGPTSPLAGFADLFRRLTDRPRSRIHLSERPLRTMMNVRVAPESAVGQAVSARLGMVLPTSVGATGTASGCTALTLGPNEFLLLAEPGRAAEIASRLSGIATSGELLAVTDVTAARTTLRLQGPAARTVLAHGCALDLQTMPAGRCAQTILAQCAVILNLPGTDPASGPADTVDVLIRSSFAAHLAEWLLLTAAEYV